MGERTKGLKGSIDIQSVPGLGTEISVNCPIK
jgi:signal transduction histidine kinase